MAVVPHEDIVTVAPSKRIVAVVNTYRKRERAQRTVAGLLENRVDHIVVVHSGACSEGELPKGYFPDGVEVYEPGWNVGVAKSWNYGIRRFPEDDLLLLCEDETPLPGFVDVLRRTPGWALQTTTQDGYWNGGHFLRPFCRQIIGEFDEAYWPVYSEDIDYFMRMWFAVHDETWYGRKHPKAGPQYCGQPRIAAPMHHTGPKAVTMEGNRWALLWAQNGRNYMTAKWRMYGPCKGAADPPVNKDPKAWV